MEGAQPAVPGANGPLTAAQSAAVLFGLKAQADGSDLLLARHLAIEQAIAGNPLLAGNRTVVLRDDAQTLKAVFSAIHHARSYIRQRGTKRGCAPRLNEIVARIMVVPYEHWLLLYGDAPLERSYVLELDL